MITVQPLAADDELDWHEFPEGDEPEILTAISPQCKRQTTTTAPASAHPKSTGNEFVFRICACHKVSDDA